MGSQVDLKTAQLRKKTFKDLRLEQIFTSQQDNNPKHQSWREVLIISHKLKVHLQDVCRTRLHAKVALPGLLPYKRANFFKF